MLYLVLIAGYARAKILNQTDGSRNKGEFASDSPQGAPCQPKIPYKPTKG